MNVYNVLRNGKWIGTVSSRTITEALDIARWKYTFTTADTLTVSFAGKE